jgi:hypothetical protein
MNDHLVSATIGIQTLYSRYCFGIDGKDPDLLADCFVSDGIFAVGEREFVGHEAIRGIATLGGIRTRHHYLNPWVKETDGHQALSTAYFLVVEPQTGANAGYGHYVDDVVCGDDGAWRFRRRDVVFLWQSEAYRSRTATITSSD